MSSAAAESGQRPTAALAPGLRVYAIGDVHGRFDLLQILSTKIRHDLEVSRPLDSVEVFLGDYVDRGPQSCEVVEWLIATPPLTDHRICLIGNHEDMLLKALEQPDMMSNWLFNGGGETLLSYRLQTRSLRVDELQEAFRQAIPESHLAFLASLSTMARIDPYTFVHAGIRPGVPIEAQDPEDLIWIREPFLSSEADFGCVVVHGHTPAPSPEIRRNRINIDTGAVFGGGLTCLVLEGAERRFLEATADD